MAGTDPQKQLLTLIRDFASEKSQGERRVIGLKKQIEELRTQLDVANTELEETKRFKEITEQELKGYEVELLLNEASIQTLEARISLIQDEISSVGSEVEVLKNQEGTSRDEFIVQMFELNAKIRKFHEQIAGYFQRENGIRTAAEAGLKIIDKNVTEVASKTLEDELAKIVCQTVQEEEECLAEHNMQKQVQSELIDCKRKLSLMEEIMKETKALQDLASSELERECASLGEELQKRCICPSCYSDMEALAGILQANEAT